MGATDGTDDGAVVGAMEGAEDGATSALNLAQYPSVIPAQSAYVAALSLSVSFPVKYVWRAPVLLVPDGVVGVSSWPSSSAGSLLLMLLLLPTTEIVSSLLSVSCDSVLSS